MDAQNLKLNLYSECTDGRWSVTLTACMYEAKHADTLQEILNIVREQLGENDKLRVNAATD